MIQMKINFEDKFKELNSISDILKKVDKYNQLIEKYCELAIKETASRVTEDYPSRNVEYAKSSKIGGLLKNKGENIKEVLSR